MTMRIRGADFGPCWASNRNLATARLCLKARFPFQLMRSAGEWDNAVLAETQYKKMPWRRMRNATLYDGWEQPSRAEVNGRSYLAHLEPMGIGSTAVESLTSYVSRLAAVHAVETGVLIAGELLPHIPLMKGLSPGEFPAKTPEYSFDAHALNGSGDRSRLWVALLERLTCIERLDLLTALPWARAISCVHLLRRNRAWCCLCYGDGPSSVEPPYERLLWAFQLVTVCPTHGRRLDTGCPTVAGNNARCRRNTDQGIVLDASAGWAVTAPRAPIMSMRRNISGWRRWWANYSRKVLPCLSILERSCSARMWQLPAQAAFLRCAQEIAAATCGIGFSTPQSRE